MSLQRPIGPAARGLKSRVRFIAAGRCAALVLAVAGAVAAAAAPGYRLLNQAAPDFTLRAAVGSNARLSEHRGQVVVVSFWSAGCGGCRAQLVALNRSLATYASAGLVVYGVGVDDDPVRAAEYARDVRVSFPMLLDPSKSVARDYQVDSLPMTVLIDRSGVIRDVLREYSRASDALYLQQVRVLLNE
ncbi:MAG: TlpA disulfide reductase family protein [Steroidobacteraceae bacterium]